MVICMAIVLIVLIKGPALCELHITSILLTVEALMACKA
ncbi:Hok/Gef family protein [Serratia sp. M24T3]